MFEAWGPWAWVAFAWAQLFITYGGYGFYLRRRLKKLEERTSNG
jgi:hypothetical protein